MRRRDLNPRYAVGSLITASLIIVGPGDLVPSISSGATPEFSEWSAPVNLGLTINSPFSDGGPALSKDGLSLYFQSDRPGGFGGIDIWVCQRAGVDLPWGPPANLGPAINTSVNEILPTFSRDGHLMFFASSRPGGFGSSDIWVSARTHTHDDFSWQTPVNLGEGVNSAAFDAGSTFFEDDDTRIPKLFFVNNRPGGVGDFDIYVSALSAGSFGPAALVPELSSPQRDAVPSIRFDGLEIFLQSNRPGGFGLLDLWVSTRETTLDAWSNPANLGATVNTAFAEVQAAVSSDRETLFFASNRPGGFGEFDLYMTQRTKLGGQ
jgi:Tol biopolymer transport system component